MEDKKQKVLIIDDEDMILNMYADKFEHSGFLVEKAKDGKQGLEKIVNGQAPDLILLDIVLPKKSGFDVLRTLKQQPVLKKIPVLILTNLGDPEDFKTCKKLGADEYLVKANCTPAEVVKKARLALET